MYFSLREESSDPLLEDSHNNYLSATVARGSSYDEYSVHLGLWPKAMNTKVIRCENLESKLFNESRGARASTSPGETVNRLTQT